MWFRRLFQDSSRDSEGQGGFIVRQVVITTGVKTTPPSSSAPLSPEGRGSPFLCGGGSLVFPLSVGEGY